MNTPSLFRLSVFACFGVTIASAPPLQAAGGTWSNAGAVSANWSESTNWTSGIVPGGTASNDSSIATFDSAVGAYGTSGSPILIDSANLNLRTLSFTGSAGSYTIGTTGGNALHLNSTFDSGIILQNTLTSTNTTITINAPLVISTAGNSGYYAVLNNNSGATNSLVVAGGISGASGSGVTNLRLTGAAASVNTISGNISNGTGTVLSIDKRGTNTIWELTGSNSYSGSTTLTNGILRINSANSLGDGSATNTINLGAATLQSSGGTYDLGVNRTIAVTGNGNIWTDSGVLTVSGNISSSTTNTLNIRGAGETILSGAISGNSLSLSKGLDGGTLTLSGSNSYGGSTTITTGILKISAANNLGNGSATNTIIFSGGTLVTAGTFDLGVNRTITKNGATNIQSDSGTLTISGAIGGSSSLTLKGAGNITVTGAISGSTLTKSDEGTVTLANTNTYTGATTVNGGVLRLNGANALPGGLGSAGGTSALTLNGGVLGLGSGDFSRAIGSGAGQFQIGAGGGGFAAYTADRSVNIGGAGAAVTWATSGFLTSGATLILGAADADKTVTWVNAINLGGSGANTRTIRVNNGSATVDAIISGALTQGGGTQSLVKTGDGTLALSGTNTYKGATTVSAGTLLINGALDAASQVNVESGGTLGGHGTIHGSVVVNSGGKLAPGNSPGVLTVGSLSLGAGSLASLEINGEIRGTDFDAIDILSGGTIQFGGAFALEFGSLLDDGVELNLFSFSTTHSGSFSSMTSTGLYAGSWMQVGDIWSLTTGGQTLSFSELTGNLTVVPEPSALALISFGLGAALVLRRGVASRKQ